MQSGLTMWSRGKLLAAAVALGALVPGWLAANVGAAVHVPSGKVFIETGTATVEQLQAEAIQACGQQELNGDKSKVQDCAVIKTFAAGACDTKYGKGNQFVTIGGYHMVAPPGAKIPANTTPPSTPYNGFMACGKTQPDADTTFTKHCPAPACTVWQRTADPNNP
jgi:hypothetical protein